VQLVLNLIGPIGHQDLSQPRKIQMANGEVISTEHAPAAIGPYSQAIALNDLIFTSGQIPLDPATMKVVEGGIGEQSERVMQNIAAVLAAVDLDFENVVKTTCFLANLDDFPAFNEVYGRYFGATPPARSTVQVARLPLGVLVEVECVASRGGSQIGD
jgi:2-iminobutanoate/2-iminopropanoate deaminase